MAGKSNMPILWQNTLLGLSDEAGTLYLRGAGRHEMTAAKMAWEWDERLSPLLPKLIAKAALLLTKGRDEGVETDVLKFIRERHFRRFFPDGRSA